MASVTGYTLITAADLYTSTASPGDGMVVGQVAVDGKTGKMFRYALAGASNLVAGNLLQESAEDTSYENMAVGTAGAVGDSFIQVTNGTATITAAQFAGGSIGVYTAGTVAVGDEYTIIGITGTLTTGGALNVFVDKPLRYAFTTSAKVVMKRPTTSGAIQFPVTTQTGIPCGVAHYAITAAQYGWVQTHGPVTALSDNSTFAVGSMLSPSLAVAGAVGVNVAGTTHGTIGWAREPAASAKGIACFLMID